VEWFATNGERRDIASLTVWSVSTSQGLKTSQAGPFSAAC
jgi:hypothetical protein